MKVEKLIEVLGVDFYTGVPDSQLKALCEYLEDTYGICKNHIIAANEGNAVGLAAGYYLSTGKIPVIYMQNSGIGNALNPLVSLMNDNIYGIPSILIIGWRGEPGVKDEPQHKYQGKITLDLLNLMDIRYTVLTQETTEEELRKQLSVFQKDLKMGKTVALVVKKGALIYEGKLTQESRISLSRESAIEKILLGSKDDIIISTTGKASREVFEIREKSEMGHERDFLTVGSMGHASSIATSIAMNKTNKRVWCIDGDGAMIMHMGAIATLGSIDIDNLVHVLINNFSHETVGGMPTVSDNIKWQQIATAVGYDYTYQAKSEKELEKVLQEIKETRGKLFVEIITNKYSRKDLGRPTKSTLENRREFMNFLDKDKKMQESIN